MSLGFESFRVIALRDWTGSHTASKLDAYLVFYIQTCLIIISHCIILRLGMTELNSQKKYSKIMSYYTLRLNRPPSPEPSKLDDWFLGAGCGSQPPSAPVPFFPEMHEELTKSWMAPFTARSRSSVSSVLTTPDGGAARGYAGIPQVERAVAVLLCP